MSSARSEPDPLLSDLGPVLTQAVLCGGVGLPPAWGPLGGGEFGPLWAWDPTRGVAVICGPDELVSGWAPVLSESLTYWRLPLDYWRPRLALVAAWMVGQPITRNGLRSPGFAPLLAWVWMSADNYSVDLYAIPRVDGRTVHHAWKRTDGSCLAYHATTLAADLATLPAHLASHDPSVAVPLALLDVPEIRARITPGDQEAAAPGPADADSRGT